MKTKIRSFLRAPKGKLLISCDLSQAETWVVAYLAKDPAMKYSLTTSDIHTDTAVATFNKPFVLITKDERYTAKRINHASSYRMSPERFTQVYNKDAVSLGLAPLSIKTARAYNKTWHELYMNIKSWWSDIEFQLGRDMTLVTPYGRKRTFFEGWSEELFKEATAYVPQTTVADHFNGYIQPELGIEGGLKKFWLKYKAHSEIKLVQQGHDSGLIEAPESHARDICLEFMADLRRPIMIDGESFTIPVDGEIGTDWGHLEKVAA